MKQLCDPTDPLRAALEEADHAKTGGVPEGKTHIRL
jgi:hypothetical protein